jgi:predicted dehydrogenase
VNASPAANLISELMTGFTARRPRSRASRWSTMASPPHPSPPSDGAKSGSKPPLLIAEHPTTRRRAKRQAAPIAKNGRPEVILVGCGPAAQQSLIPAVHALEQSGALKVRAIVESDDHAREWCSRMFPDVSPLASFETVVCPPDALVIISTPARFHAAQAGSAQKRGWHVLCANPFATTAHEGTSMISAADRHERLLAVDLPHRFFPAVRYLRTLCRDHLLGPLINFRIHEGTARQPIENAAPGPEKFESPDGVLHEFGLPLLDLLTWCLGNASVKTYADDAMGGVEANAFIELAFNESVRGTVHLSRDWSTDCAYTFTFERGIVRWISTQPSRLTLHVGSSPFAIEGDLVVPLSPGYAPAAAPLFATREQAIIAEIHNILGAMAGRESLRNSAVEAMPSLALIEDCYARRTQLPQPWLPQNEAVQARASAPPVALRRP